LSSEKRVIPLEEQTAFCEICGEEFEYKFAFAEEHIKKYPFHRIYRTEGKKKD
jgi:hypothetical protein